MALADMLEAGRIDFLDACAGLTPEASRRKPSERSWSVLELIEHVVVFEERHLAWLAEAQALPRPRNTDLETQLFTQVRSRAAKLEAPPPLLPKGRFDDVRSALTAFTEVRSHTLRAAAKSLDALGARAIRHPHFGDINGIEVLNVIDAHSRRHAEQIRETRAVLLDPACLDSPLEGQSFTDLTIPEYECDALRLADSTLTRVRLPGARIGTLVLKDVRLEDCDLSNARIRRLSLVRAAFSGCRLTGLNAPKLEWQNVVLRGCDLSYAQLSSGRFRLCEFEECNLREAALEDTDLSGTVFRNCTLTRTVLHRARLRDADLRSSNIDGIDVTPGSLQGAIVSPAQAMALARLLGLKIQ